mmetsp:Transcript_27139/g.64462  ORF Transcript_27139/g.64462 Transcript_27139/m.64462 type:complete len:213 (+) Transcript_27139:884-1522(+)
MAARRRPRVPDLGRGPARFWPWPAGQAGFRRRDAHGAGGRPPRLPARAARCHRPQFGPDHRPAADPARWAPARRAHRGRARVQRTGRGQRLHRHPAGRDRPPPGRGPHPPAGPFRCLDRPAEPPPVDLARRAGHRERAARRPRGWSAVDRPRSLQGHQRHPRPRGRRRAAGRSRLPAAQLCSPLRPDHGRHAGGRHVQPVPPWPGGGGPPRR